MDSRPASPLLPSFAIRHLNGPQLPPGVVQITGRQYNEAIKSLPDSTLQYHDDDDGELITVGSSFELGQRLDEPVQKTTPSSSKPRYEVGEDQMMHIFDISRTTGASLAVWRDHEAYTSKTRGKRPALPSNWDIINASGGDVSRHTTSYLEHRALETARSTAEPILRETSPVPSAAGVKSLATPLNQTSESQTAKLPQVQNILVDVFSGLEAGLEPLADLLDTAAAGLQAAADKTRHAENTPVANVLSGFKGILTEVGHLGLQILAELADLNDEDHRTMQTRQDKPMPQAVGDAPSSVPVDQQIPAAKQTTDTSAKRVSFADCHDQNEIDQSMSTLQPQTPPMSWAPIEPEHETKQNSPGIPTASVSMLAPSYPSLKPLLQNASHPMRPSILDFEHQDPEFSARYPPLMSLRKSKSVSGLHDNVSRPLNTNSALHRYPSVSQLEEQSRMELTERARDKYAQKTMFSPTSKSPETTASPAKQRCFYKPPSVEYDPDADAPRAVTSNTGTPASTDSTTLPGAWPDFKASESQSSPVSPLGAPGSSVASTTHNFETDAIEATSLLSHRASSPVSDTYSGALFPRRAQTVTGANPAARLNGPFDPLAQIPALQPRPQRSVPNFSFTPTVLNLGPRMSPPDLTRPTALPASYRARLSNNDSLQRSKTVSYADRCRQQPAPPLATRPLHRGSWQADRAEEGLSRQPVWIQARPGPAKPAIASGSNGYPTFHPIQNPRAFPMRKEVPSLRPATEAKLEPLVSAPLVSRPQQPSTVFPSMTPIAPTPMPLASATSASSATATASASTTFNPLPFRQPSTSQLFPKLTVQTTSNVHTGRSGVVSQPLASSRVEECVKILRNLGYGAEPNEASRLGIYAGAAAGDVEEAIEMIEEEREAQKLIDESKMADRQ